MSRSGAADSTTHSHTAVVDMGSYMDGQSYAEGQLGLCSAHHATDRCKEAKVLDTC